MDDSTLETKSKEGDLFSVTENGTRYLFRQEVQDTPIRFYKKNSVFLKYKKGCPLFKTHIAQSNKDIVQFLLDCSERGKPEGYTRETRTNLTCKNMFKCIMKNKVKGLNEYNSCHECTHFYEGLVPKWESLIHPHPKQGSNHESKHSSQTTSD